MAVSKRTNCWKLFYDWSTSFIGKNPPDNSKNDETSPAKKPSLVYSMGPCGGIGGAENNMAADPTTRIVKVMVRHGRLLDAIRIMHLHDGVSAWTHWWGVIGLGGQSSEIALEDDEYLTCVSGHISIESSGSVVIGSLSFVSNKRTYGPYGEAAGTPFNLDAQGGKIVGFFGRSGSDLNAIGIYTTPQ